MALTVRRRSERALLVAAVAWALVLALSACGQSSGERVVVAPTSESQHAAAPGSAFTLLQWNVCLSGLARCYRKVAYPAVLAEAVARIHDARPDAVTFSEACRNDVALIARRTGYHLRFSRVIYRGRPLACIRPGGRGLFGDAVLTRSAVESTDNHDFHAQAGIERRRWLCVTTRVGIDVCTAHLNTRSATERAGNDAQCAELAALLARRAGAHTVIFGGDVNRDRSCAPRGLWTRADGSADQHPGLQQVYGSGALRSPAAQVVAAMHSDHDVLVVRARLPARTTSP